MKNFNPLISVVLPVYNRPSVINTIQSLLNQTYKNFELLIIDNCSTDNTVDLIKNKFTDERIHIYVNESNMGQTYSIKKGFSLAKGLYIARIDADDLATSDRFQKQVSFLENNPEFGFCGSWVQFITDDDKKSFVIRTCQTDLGFRFLQTICCGMYHPALMVRKEILTKNNISYDEKLHMAEDYNLWNDLLSVTKGLNIPEILLYYRRGVNNDSKKHAQLMKKEYYEVRKKICDNIENKEEMSNIIEIELKRNRNFIDFFTTMLFYRKYIKKYIKKTELDYSLIKEQVRNHHLTSFLSDNDNFIFRLLFRFYKVVRKIYYITR